MSSQRRNGEFWQTGTALWIEWNGRREGLTIFEVSEGDQLEGIRF